MASSPLARLRKACLALPEAHEVEAWGEPTFRIRNKLFAMYAATSASIMLGAGVPLIVVSRQLGHANPQITATVYAHLLGDEQLDGAAAVFEAPGAAETLRETLREDSAATENPMA